MIPFIWHLYSGKGKTIVEECRSVGARAQGRAKGLTALGSLTPSFDWRPFRGLVLRERQHWKRCFDLCYRMAGKEKGDRDNTEFLDPARSKSRRIPREPASPLYCLSSELWLSLMIESDPIDITFHQAGPRTINPSISTLSVTYLRVRFLLRAHMEDKQRWSSCQTPRKASSSSQYALARKWQLSRKKNQRTLTADLEKSQNSCLPNREGTQWIQRFGNISR